MNLGLKKVDNKYVVFFQGTVSEANPQPAALVVASQLLAKIEKFRSLQANWGTYNEKPVNSKACDRCAHFVSWFAFYRPRVSLQVYPTSSGDVGIEWKWGGKEYAVIFSEAGARLLVDDPDSDEDMAEHSFVSEVKLLETLQLLGFSYT